MESFLYLKLLMVLIVVCIKQDISQNSPMVLSSLKAAVLENSSVTLTCSNTTGTLVSSHWDTSLYDNQQAYCYRFENSCQKTPFLKNITLFDCICNENGSYTVLLKHVDRYQHGSIWKCGNRFEQSNTVVINVSVPVTSAVLIQSGNELLYENTSVKFTCTSYSLPSAQLHWYRSYRTSTVEITDSQDADIKRETYTREDNVIRVVETLAYRVDRPVNGWNVYCTATNWQNNTVTSAYTRLSVMYPPDHPPVTDGFSNGNTYTVVENENASLSCSVTGGNPLPKLEWNCDRIDNITLKEQITNNETVTSYLSLTAKRTDGKSCTCKMGHVLSNVSTYVNFDILYRASVKQFVVSGKLNEHTVPVVGNESTFITFSCEIDSNPNSTAKIITPNGTEIIFTDTNMIEYSHFLSSCVDNGTYTCSGSNDYNNGHPGLAYLFVFVKCTPMPSTLTTTDIRSQLYVPVILQFKVVAYLDPEFTWEKWTNGSWQQLTNGKQYHISSRKLLSNLTVRNVTTPTTDVYRVLVVNEIGRLVQNYKVQPFGAPETPKEFRHIEELLTYSSVTLLWKPGLNGGTSQTFLITYIYEKEDVFKNIAIQDTGIAEMNLTVHGLYSDTRYTLQLVAVNSLGISDSITLRIKTMGYSDGTQTNSLVIDIISGTMTLLVLAISLAVFILLRRRYKKKRNSSKEERSYDNLTEMTAMPVGQPYVIHTPLYEGLRTNTERRNTEQAYAILRPEQGFDGATFQTYTKDKVHKALNMALYYTNF